MCGRIFVRPEAKTQNLLHELNLDHFTLPDTPNVAPTEAIPVVHYWEDQLTISPMRWWLVPSWSDGPSTKFAMFNARIETIASSRAYKGPLKYRRGIVPVSGFVEWKREADKKQPYYFEGQNQPLALAAIWETWRDELLSVSILTQPANDNFSRYHNRMPVMLSVDRITQWLDHSISVEEELAAVLGASVELSARAVGTQINNARVKEWV
ncbi:SOS response-associated peptidase [Zhongshania marina]|uniref:Abasic site processing protein n=1 Tax=Zhongshania marina TaxID=2304603 RepID=A0A2S4HF55_9GAMM|nr:SOS response-associated peptidase [Marortus luteolus]POP52607.1 SOS response-associated peptidase [Marortus luteolus]